jgi:hypothetical protein
MAKFRAEAALLLVVAFALLLLQHGTDAARASPATMIASTAAGGLGTASTHRFLGDRGTIGGDRGTIGGDAMRADCPNCAPPAPAGTCARHLYRLRTQYLSHCVHGLTNG